MAGPNWSDDDPNDALRILSNTAIALADARQLAINRDLLDETVVKRWHTTVFDGCTIPSPAYVGRFRGEAQPDLIDYEVGIGAMMPDGWPEGVGIWSHLVAAEVADFMIRLADALQVLDLNVAPGRRPVTADVLRDVVQVVAVAHGEWVRLHPFVNGNGRIARLLAAHISLRYGLPVFVQLKPRPDDVAYARAAKRSMGRPPSFVGDHSEAVGVFAHLLALHLLSGP